MGQGAVRGMLRPMWAELSVQNVQPQINADEERFFDPGCLFVSIHPVHLRWNFLHVA